MADYALEGPTWATTTITWSFAQANYPGQTDDFGSYFSTGVMEDELRDAFTQWEGASNLDFVEVPDSSSVDIRLGYATFDGPYGALGQTSYSYTTAGGVSTFQPDTLIRFDSAERYTLVNGEEQLAGGVTFQSVALHEIGHAVGLAHYTGEPAIMQPIASPSVTSLQQSDINGITALYGAVQNPCFASGTLIRTHRGEVRVEELAVGDLVVTAAGEHRPVMWLGHRRVECTRHPRPEAVWPVRVEAGALGDGVPARDLWLSPDHAVAVTCLDEVLIPVKHLINGATIAQVPVDHVTYWHVELESHDILLAEGLPAESFLDTGVRAAFENAGEHTMLHPDWTPLSLDDFCRPLVQAGPVVEAVRTRLVARAFAQGWTTTDEADLHALADGEIIRPALHGDVARFVVPARTRELRLVSRHFVPEMVDPASGDGRRLGVPLRGLALTDGLALDMTLAIDDPRLEQGFSFVQEHGEDRWRWTDGNAVLPPALWAGAEEVFFLRLTLAPDRGTLRAWQEPSCGLANGLPSRLRA